MAQANTQVGRCFVLFLSVFGLWQAVQIIFPDHSAPLLPQQCAYTIIHVSALVASLWFISRDSSNFKDHGFWWPEPGNPLKYASSSALLVVVHNFVTVFLPGAIFGFEIFPATSQIPWGIMNALLSGLASESVFRGYIQVNLTEQYGFPRAVCVTSAMYSFHRLPLLLLPTLNPTSVINETASLFMASMFLGFLFRQVKTLVSPVTFHVFWLLSSLIPFKAATEGYASLLFGVFAYISLVPLLHLLVTQD